MTDDRTASSEGTPPESDIAPQFSHILLRDDWTCQQCGYKAAPDEPMESVLTNEDGDPKNPENYDTLCEDCARNERHGFSARKQQRQQAINTENRLPSEQPDSYILLIPFIAGMFCLAVGSIGSPYLILTGQIVAGGGLHAVKMYAFFLVVVPAVSLTLLYLLVVAASHIEPGKFIFTRFRYHVGGWIYYHLYLEVIKPRLYELYFEELRPWVYRLYSDEIKPRLLP
jgi:rubredoxin